MDVPLDGLVSCTTMFSVFRCRRYSLRWLLTALLLIPSYGWTQDVPQEQHAMKDERVFKIIYQGNARTKASVMDRLSGLLVGMRLTEVDVDKIRKSFLDSDLFSAVNLFFQDDDEGVTVTVMVKENLGLHLVPYNLSFNTAYYGGGLLLTDTNFLGEQKVVALGAAYSNLGPAGVLSYQDPHFILDNLVLTTYVTGGDLLRQEASMDGTQFAVFPYLYTVQGIRTNWAFDGQWHLFSEVRAMEIETGTTEVAQYGLFRHSVVINPSVGVEYNGQTAFEYFLRGLWAGVRYSHGFSLTGLPSYDSVGARGQWNVAAPLDGMAEAGFAADYGNQTLLAMNPLSGKGFRMLPANSFSGKDVGFYASYDYPMVHFSWGVIALGAFYEAGFYSNGLDSQPTTDFFQGPGLGVHLYLDRVSRTALGADFSYNLSNAMINFSINAGLSLN